MALRVRKTKTAIPRRCPLSESMGLLRGAWAPSVIWCLGAQPRRFGEIRVELPGIAARVLTARLRQLEAKGLVTRTLVPDSPATMEYALSALGHELVPAIAVIVKVSHQLKEHAPPRARRRA